MTRVLFAAATALALSACAHDPANLMKAYTEAANDLDPKCGKKVHVEMKQREIIGWPVTVPVLTGTYDKVCNPEAFLDANTKEAIRQIVAEALAPPASAPPVE